MIARALDFLAHRKPRIEPHTTEGGPAMRAFDITPGKDLEHVTRWIWVGRAGCLCVTLADDNEPVRIYVRQDGTRLDIAVKRIHKGDRDPSRIVGFY